MGHGDKPPQILRDGTPEQVISPGWVSKGLFPAWTLRHRAPSLHVPLMAEARDLVLVPGELVLEAFLREGVHITLSQGTGHSRSWAFPCPRRAGPAAVPCTQKDKEQGKKSDEQH